MSNSARKQLRELQKSLYDKTYANAKTRSAIGSPTILNYSENYQASLPRNFQNTTLKSVLSALHKSSFALYGDFHTLKQSQRGLLRLIKAFVQTYKKPAILALEMFKASDQKHLDQFQAGIINERQLLELTNYGKDWGFPWPNYKVVVDFAIENRIKLFGVNTDHAGRDSLQKRDDFTAASLVKLAEKHPNHLIFCLIGEYHLADDHLPRSLEEQTRKRGFTGDTLRLFTNVDDYYFRMKHSHSAPTTEYLALNEGSFAIQNTPPWIKWQTYVIWEEMRAIEAYDDFDEEDYEGVYTEDVFDTDSQVLDLMKHVVDFLELPDRKGDLTRFNVLVSPEDETFDDLAERAVLSSRGVDTATHRLSLDGYYFAENENTMMVSDVSLNSLANLVGQFLRKLSLRDTPELSDEEIFYERILNYAAGMVASKILNPRRKGPDLWVYRRLLKLNRGKRLIGHAQTKREAAKVVIRFHEWVSRQLIKRKNKLPKLPRSIVEFDHFSYHEVSKSLGDVLGYIIYSRVMSQTASPEFMRKLFVRSLKRKPSQDFLEIYCQIMH